MNLKEKITELKDGLISRFYRNKAKYSLIRRYLYESEVERIMEKWIKKRILEGQKGRREELVEKRKRIEEMEQLITFLKKQ